MFTGGGPATEELDAITQAVWDILGEGTKWLGGHEQGSDSAY